jgi:hypothetical protein
MISPLIELCELPKDQRFPYLLSDGKRVRTVTGVVEWCAKRGGCCTMTVWRAYAMFRKGGRRALISRPRKDKGASRWFVHHKKAAIFAAYLWLGWGQTIAEIHAAIRRDRELLEVPAATQVPSYDTVRRWLRSNAPALVSLALDGQKLHRARMTSYAKRGLLVERKDRGL